MNEPYLPSIDRPLSVSVASDLIREVLANTLPVLVVEGEVSGFKVNQSKFVFFDIKDQASSLGCFMMVFNLKFPLEDGMRVRLIAEPTLTKWGKFSLTVREVMPVGEGALKKSFELLKKQLQSEGLFDEQRKRQLPEFPSHIGVVGSEGSAGWQDFLKVINTRFGGLTITLADSTVQGMQAPQKLIASLGRLNNLPSSPDVIAIIRGGGSLDDLAAFNHPDLVRAIAGSRVPVITGIGHETDISLSDLAADKRAATPSNVAELLVPDQKALLKEFKAKRLGLDSALGRSFDEKQLKTENFKTDFKNSIQKYLEQISSKLRERASLLRSLDPSIILRRGYATLKKDDQYLTSVSNVIVGDEIEIGLLGGQLTSEVTRVRKNSKF